MPISPAIWTPTWPPTDVPDNSLVSQRRFDDMIAAEAPILSAEWMLIRRQQDTGRDSRVDRLAVAPAPSL